MKRVALFLLLALVTVMASGCLTPGPPDKTQLQIREFQTRHYDTNDFKMVMKAVMNTLQDDYYIVKEAELDLGLITAQKEVDVASGGEVFLAILFRGANARYKKNSITEASANISEFGDQIRVRINFQVKVLDNKGMVIKVQQVQDAQFYQDFFSKVDKAVFLAKEKL